MQNYKKSIIDIAVKCGWNSNSNTYNFDCEKRIMELQKLFSKSNNSIKEINVPILIHFLGTYGIYDSDNVKKKCFEMIDSLNMDFDGSNSLVKYKSIINRVFFDNSEKRDLYLSKNFINAIIPFRQSGIFFELKEIYFYPRSDKFTAPINHQFIKHHNYDIQKELIKQYIDHVGAYAWMPERFLNIWIFDSDNIEALSFFSNFPWDIQQTNQTNTIEQDIGTLNPFQGIYLHKYILFPEEYGDNKYWNSYKCLTHAIGHYFGLSHIDSESNCKKEININYSKIDNTSNDNTIDDYYDQLFNIQKDPSYNPEFTNFMNCWSKDMNTCSFNPDQLLEMNFIISHYFPLMIDNNFNKNNKNVIIPQRYWDPNIPINELIRRKIKDENNLHKKSRSIPKDLNMNTYIDNFQ